MSASPALPTLTHRDSARMIHNGSPMVTGDHS